MRELLLSKSPPGRNLPLQSFLVFQLCMAPVGHTGGDALPRMSVVVLYASQHPGRRSAIESVGSRKYRVQGFMVVMTAVVVVLREASIDMRAAVAAAVHAHHGGWHVELLGTASAGSNSITGSHPNTSNSHCLLSRLASGKLQASPYMKTAQMTRITPELRGRRASWTHCHSSSSSRTRHTHTQQSLRRVMWDAKEMRKKDCQ